MFGTNLVINYRDWDKVVYVQRIPVALSILV